MEPRPFSDELVPNLDRGDAREVLKEKIDRSFLLALDTLFPEKTPELEDSLDKIRYASGQRSVVYLLRSIWANG